MVFRGLSYSDLGLHQLVSWPTFLTPPIGQHISAFDTKCVFRLQASSGRRMQSACSYIRGLQNPEEHFEEEWFGDESLKCRFCQLQRADVCMSAKRCNRGHFLANWHEFGCFVQSSFDTRKKLFKRFSHLSQILVEGCRVGVSNKLSSPIGVPLSPKRYPGNHSPY